MVGWLKQVPIGPMANFCYLVGDPATMQCAVVDPGWEAPCIVATASEEGFSITAIWLTHTHFDHIGALAPLLQIIGDRHISRIVPVPIYVHELECGQFADYKTPVHPTRDRDVLTVDTIPVRCLHTPGHTPGGQCFVGDGFVLTGDTLFVDAIGRTDLPGADPQQMFASLRQLAKLPLETIVYAGHDYGRTPTTTIGEQLQRNPYLRCTTMEAFLRL